MDHNLRKVSSRELIRRVAETLSGEALDELISHRKLFQLNGSLTRFTQFAHTLREREFPSVEKFEDEYALDDKLEMTYQMLTAKFVNLKTDEIPKQKGPFCNGQYEYLNMRLTNGSHVSIGYEQEVVDLITALAYSQIRYCWMEACRTLDPHFARYRWTTPTSKLDIIRPRWVKVGPFREWLTGQFQNPKYEDRSEIKDHIRNYFGRPDLTADDFASTDDPIDTSMHEHVHNTLYRDVGMEKVSNMDKQRPSIKALGEKKLYALCQEILEEVLEPGFSFMALSDKYGITKVNLSRFAGLEWTKPESNAKVTDLWKNLALVILSDHNFTDAATDAGILPQLKKALGRTQSKT